MEDLRFALLVIGGCAIVAILAHGLWSLRKNNSSAQPRIEPQPDPSLQREPEGFDEYGIGEVRVVSRQDSTENENGIDEGEEPVVIDALEAQFDVDEGLKTSSSVMEDESQTDDAIDKDEITPLADIPDSSQIGAVDAKQSTGHQIPSQEETRQEPEPPKLYASVVSNPKPKLYQAREDSKPEPESESGGIPEPPPFLLNPDQVSAEDTPPPSIQDVEQAKEVDDFSLDQAPLQAEPEIPPESVEVTEKSSNANKKAPAKKRSRSILRKRIEPTLGEDQMRMSFDEESESESASAEVDSQSAPATAEQEVLVLNVRAPQEQEIQGAALLPMLLTLGFKFGDQDIFHRHVNSNGKGPVLFSLANMFKPGVFDIDNLENFTTQGVSLFMILPIEGDPHQVFNMMHNAARKLAEEFSGQILDGRRSVLTKQGLQQYVEKIREFERQRMIARH